jgi:hypothetical protein
MDSVRTVFEEIVEDAGRRAAAIRKLEVESKGNFTPWRDALVKTKALSGGEGVVFQALYGYLSGAGAHQLGSRS